MKLKDGGEDVRGEIGPHKNRFLVPLFLGCLPDGNLSIPISFLPE
jgi:hypothetical protein